MGVKVTGISSTKHSLERMTKRTSKRALRAFKKGGEKIRDKSRSNAPKKTGSLERSITMVIDQGSFFSRRHSILIGIDESKLGIGYQKYGFDYGDHLHETEWNPGKISMEKIRAGHDVGPEFMKRALDELADELSEEIQQIYEEEARKV